MPLSALDQRRLSDALLLAEGSIGLSEPNPRVGCVIGRDDGSVLGRGFTQEAGGAHAEVMALRESQRLGHELSGATVWVTLEPCAHHGRTPPCADALIAAGIARVVVASVDPFAQVNGAGVLRLRNAGIKVDLAEGDIARAARELNIGYFSRIRRLRPWLRLKVASSLDGRTALLNGQSQWITGPAAREDGHRWRKRAGAVLSGIGTVLEDDPRLDVRLVDTARQPMRVVVDSRLATPTSARVLAPPGEVVVFTASSDTALAGSLRASGADVVVVRDANGKVDLLSMLKQLADRGVNELHVEAGHKLNASLLRAGLVDELLIYLAPRLLGIGREMAAFGPLQSLSESMDFRFTDVQRVGEDLRVIARPAERDAF